MPDPQPTQMGDSRITREELVSIIADAVDELKPFSPELDEADISESLYRRMTAAITRPAAGFGDDGELVERLRLLAKGHKFDAVPVVTEAADRLILYREALREDREYFAQRADADLDVSGYTGNEEMRRLVAIDAALAQARQEGDK